MQYRCNPKKKMRQPPRSTFGHITSVLVDVRAPQAQTPRAVDTADAEAPCPVARRASKFRGVANTNSAQTNQIERGGANLQHPLRSRGFKQLPSATFPASLALILSRHFHIRFLALGLVDNYLLSSVRFGCQLFYTLF